MNRHLLRAGRLVIGTGVLVGSVAAASSLAAEPLVLGSTASAAARPAPSVVPVSRALLACVGPETEGVAKVPAVAGSSLVVAATAPDTAMRGLPTAAAPGQLTIAPHGAAPVLSPQRGAIIQSPLAGAVIAEVSSTGGLAPGTAAIQVFAKGDTADRGMTVTPCLAPRADLWLLAGGGETSRRERLVIANPGANAVTVDVEVLGAKGRLAVGAGSRLAVPPQGRVALLLDGLAPQEAAPAIHLTATGGVITAALEDAWIAGTAARGRDDIAPGDTASTEVLIPGVSSSGAALLRVAVPGEQEAVLTVRALTADGAKPLSAEQAIRVAGKSTRDLDLAAFGAGVYAVQIRSDRPVAASVRVDRKGTTASDFAWIGTAAAIGALAGSPLPGATASTLAVTGTGADWAATVVVVGSGGAVTERTISGEGDTTSAVPLGDARAVWVRPVTGTLRASVTSEAGDPAAPLVSAWALHPAAVTATDVPVAEVRR